MAAESGVAGISVRTLAHLTPHWRRCLLIALAIWVGTGYNAFFPLSIRVLIDGAAANHDVELLVRVVAGILVLYAASAAAGIWRDRATAELCARVLAELRAAMFARLQRLPLPFFEQRQAGDVLSYLSNDVAALEQPLRYSLPWSLHATTQILVSLVILVLLNWQLALVSVLVLPLAYVGPRLVTPRSSAASEERRGQEAAMLGSAAEALQSQSFIRAFGLQAIFARRFEDLLRDVTRSSARAGFLALLVGRSTSLAVALGQVIVVVAGTLLVVRGQFSVGALVGFVGVLLNVGISFSDLAAALPEWLQATGSMRRIEALLSEQPFTPESAGATAVPPLHEEIRFDKVSFAYSPDRPILHSLSFTIQAGSFVAFVGSSGSGKSTILNLILRLYEPTSGAITFDGQPLRNIAEASLRQQIAVVPQEPLLFNATIRDNIVLGAPGADDGDIEAAAKAAQVHDVIAGLPLGYDAPAGERGSRLSGGQRQRVALARAVLRRPALLVLDEATSALDPETEAAFNASLEDIAQGRTVIDVTHRLAGVTHADMIFVVDRGRIVEQGTHAQLMALEGAYWRLWNKQAGFGFSDDGRRAVIDAGRLADISLFKGVQPGVLQSVTRLFFTQRYAAGAEIIQEGAAGDTFCILVRGTADVVRNGAVADVLEDGDFFGDADLLRDAPSSATVRARTDCLVLALKAEHFRALVEAVPVLRAILEQVDDVRAQRDAMRLAALDGRFGWSDQA